MSKYSHLGNVIIIHFFRACIKSVPESNLILDPKPKALDALYVPKPPIQRNLELLLLELQIFFFKIRNTKIINLFHESQKRL